MEKLNFEVMGNTYVIGYPNTGELRQIEILKAKLSRGEYENIEATGHETSNFVAEGIEIEAHLRVLCTKMVEDMNKKNATFETMTIKEMTTLRIAWRKQYVTYRDSILEEIRKMYEELEDNVE